MAITKNIWTDVRRSRKLGKIIPSLSPILRVCFECRYAIKKIISSEESKTALVETISILGILI